MICIEGEYVAAEGGAFGWTGFSLNRVVSVLTLVHADSRVWKHVVFAMLVMLLAHQARHTISIIVKVHDAQKAAPVWTCD